MKRHQGGRRRTNLRGRTTGRRRHQAPDRRDGRRCSGRGGGCGRRAGRTRPSYQARTLTASEYEVTATTAGRHPGERRPPPRREPRRRGRLFLSPATQPPIPAPARQTKERPMMRGASGLRFPRRPGLSRRAMRRHEAEEAGRRTPKPVTAGRGGAPWASRAARSYSVALMVTAAPAAPAATFTPIRLIMATREPPASEEGRAADGEAPRSLGRTQLRSPYETLIVMEIMSCDTISRLLRFHLGFATDLPSREVFFRCGSVRRRGAWDGAAGRFFNITVASPGAA